MNDDSGFLQRYGGHLVLLIVAVLLVLGSWGQGLATFFEFDFLSEAEMMAEPTPVVQAEEPGPTPVGATAPLFDLASLPVLSDNGLSPDLMPITYKPILPEHEFITYTVEAGDTAFRIAQKFDINEETILGGNPFLSNDAGILQVGAVLNILPVNGVLHEVQEGETLESLSLKYGIPVEDIIAYAPNKLQFPYRLYPDTQIVVPGAVVEVFFWEPPSLTTFSSGGSAEALGGIYLGLVGTGRFIWPIGSRSITQYYWYGHPGLDIGSPEGSGVYASDQGTVTYAAWSPYCYGNLVVINHANGYETFYAHLSSINVSVGQQVYQGTVIAASGNTGCSSGPHLHFEIRFNRGRYDPLSYLP